MPQVASSAFLRDARRRLLRAVALVALACGLGLALRASASEGKEKAAGAQSQAKSATEAAKPAYRLGPPLDGRLDLGVLRNARRVAAYRVALPPLVTDVPYRRNRAASIRVVVVLEFGSESGVAEAQDAMKEIASEQVAILGSFNTPRLATVDGKLELKETLIRSLNRQLRTAQARQIYFTEFFIQG
jgi:flagellar basal body-associated protein FliL